MAYSELIKNFCNIRHYMHDFYVYGFKNRSEYNQKSSRSYDNERRRLESWLGKYMHFTRDTNGKNVFIAVDSRTVESNPLYEAFKAKSFTDNDIMLYFYLMDILHTHPGSNLKFISETLNNTYLGFFPDSKTLDDSTLRKKLDEYIELGIVKKETQGKTVIYSIAKYTIDILPFLDTIKFFSETGELGVFGSYLLDKEESKDNIFTFKHHYILHALESEILYDLLNAINQKLSVELQTNTTNNSNHLHVLPFKIFISVQSGRKYLECYSYASRNIAFFRLDNIKLVKLSVSDESYDEKLSKSEVMSKHLWGVAGVNNSAKLEHVSLTLSVDKSENFIIRRLEREKRCGTITKLGDDLYEFSADVYNAMELLPWVNTFIGRIVSFKCSNKMVEIQFRNNLKAMFKSYLD